MRSDGERVVAVGDEGTVLVLEGGQITELTTGVEEVLFAVDGTSMSDLYIGGGGGTLMHYNGSEWSDADINGGTNWIQDLVATDGTVYTVGSDERLVTSEISGRDAIVRSIQDFLGKGR